MIDSARLRIIHIARAPVGGVLRHIVDLSRAQAAAGHMVGLVCDSSTGGDLEDSAIADLAPALALGSIRLPMPRSVSFGDLRSARRALDHIASLAPDVIHCHGAKGGVYGRLIGGWLGRRRRIARIYAPHGGSLHYGERSLEGRFYFAVERALEYLTDALVHVSAYEAETYRRKIGAPRCRAVVVRNGLRPDEFSPVATAADAADLIFLGTFRDLKGIDVFLEAIAHLGRRGHCVSAQLIGHPDPSGRYETLAQTLGIADRVTFHPPMSARAAFALGRVVVVPSRAESMPYVVLEAIAAGRPIIATAVGGIPEIFGPRAGELVPAGDSEILAQAIANTLADPQRAMHDAADRRAFIEPRFNVAVMQTEIERLYRDCLSTAVVEPASTALRRA